MKYNYDDVDIELHKILILKGLINNYWHYNEITLLINSFKIYCLLWLAGILSDKRIAFSKMQI